MAAACGGGCGAAAVSPRGRCPRRDAERRVTTAVAPRARSVPRRLGHPPEAGQLERREVTLRLGLN